MTLLLPKDVSRFKHLVEEVGVLKGVWEDSDFRNGFFNLFRWMVEKGREFDVSKIAYWLFVQEGYFPDNMGFFFNRKPQGENRKEKDIQKALIDNWDLSPFPDMDISFSEESFVLRGSDRASLGYIVDVLGERSGKKIFFELKGFRTKGKKAMEQVISYVRAYNRANCDDRVDAAYIVAKGFSWDVFDDDLDFDIGVVGYFVEGDRISFVPWKRV